MQLPENPHHRRLLLALVSCDELPLSEKEREGVPYIHDQDQTHVVVELRSAGAWMLFPFQTQNGVSFRGETFVELLNKIPASLSPVGPLVDTEFLDWLLESYWDEVAKRPLAVN